MKGRKPLTDTELIDTVISVRDCGINATAEKMCFEPKTIMSRIKRADRRFGVKFFSDYDYNRLTYLGKEKLNEITASS